MRFPKAIAKSKGFSRIFAFGLIIFSGAGLINLCTVCAETTDDACRVRTALGIGRDGEDAL